MKVKKHNIQNIILLIGILFVVSFISITYAALNTNMFIDGNAIVRADVDLRITDIKILNVTNGASETYNSKYTKDTITNGIILPNDNSTITYKVVITNKGNQKYAIKNIIIESSNNENISFETNCSENEIVDENSTKEIEITYRIASGSENKNAIILKFNFSRVYTITFDANEGNVDIANKLVVEGDTYGDLPIPTRNDYSFLGWYTEIGNGEKIVSTTKVAITKNQTLYARWEIYSEYTYLYEGDYTFDGTNYIDTGIYLFSEENISKNFEISFEIKQRISKNQYPAMVSAMDETGSPWPGIVYRVKSSTQDEFAANASTLEKVNKTYQNTINKVSIKRVNNIIYIAFEDGFDTKVADFSSMLSNPFDISLTFGAQIDANGNPFRYFNGTLANMSVKFYDTSKKIIYNSNNGTDLQYEQCILEKDSINLKSNTFLNGDYVFTGWNTKTDGSGTSYNDNDIIDLSSISDSIILYAQWSHVTYAVKYDPNGGTGDMEDQIFTSGESQNLFTNTFTKDGSNFIKWNTRSDGLGTSYYDGENVNSVSNGEDITLYALWGNKTEYLGDNVFNGDNYIDTGLTLFSQENINKDFEILFEVKELTYVNKLDTILSIMDESGSPWPGIVFRLNDSRSYQIGANATSSVKKEKTYSTTNKKVSIKKVEKILYISFNNGDNEKFLDMTKLSPFDVPLTFGSSLDASGNPFRYFTGTLSDIRIYLFD